MHIYSSQTQPGSLGWPGQMMDDLCNRSFWVELTNHQNRTFYMKVIANRVARQLGSLSMIDFTPLRRNALRVDSAQQYPLKLRARFPM